METKSNEGGVRRVHRGYTVIGMLVTIIAGLINPDLGMFVLATIVCTAGISLVAWIPIWMLIGMILYYIVWFFHFAFQSLTNRNSN
jgi:hypothetical protein